MALTKWGFLWGGPVPDPTFWGGNLPVGPPTPPFEVQLNTSRIAASSLWLARDDPANALTDPIYVIAGAVMGYVAGTFNLPRFHPPGDVTCIVTREFPGGPFNQSVKLLRSSEGGAFEISDDSTEAINQMHATLRPHQNVTGAAAGYANAAGFVGIVDSNPEFETWFYPISQIDGVSPIVPVKSNVWNNELGVLIATVRVVDVLRTNHGPLMVIGHQDELYLKSTWGSGPATAAAKIGVNLSFDGWSPDLNRFHVVITNNDILVIYYAVTQSGKNATAVLAYRPFHDTYGDDLPFDARGVIVQPRIIWEGLVPTVSHTGAMRHQVSSDILVALQDTNDINQVGRPNIYWLTTRGLGTVFDPVPDIWDEETHPNLFGGKTESASPDLAIDILSVGWSGNRQESLFNIVGSLEYQETSSSYAEYENTYATGNQPEAWDTQRLCLGQVWVVTEGESNVGGRHSLELVRSTAYRTNKQDRQGYDVDAQIAGDDLFDVKSLLTMTLAAGNQVPAVVGPDASTGGSAVFPITGMVKGGGLNFPIPSSRVVIPGSSSFRGESVCLSLWVYPRNSGSSANNSIAYMDGNGAPAFWLRFNQLSQVFQWQVNVTGTGQIDIDSAVPTYIFSFDRWYHVTALYNHELEISQLFIFGILVAQADAGNGDVLDLHPTTNNPIILGEVSPSSKSLFCKMDNFAVGFDSVKRQEVVAAYFHGLNSPEGPVRSNRTNSLTTQDFVYATASIARANGTVYTVSARQISVSIEDVFDYQVVFDVWRLDRGTGQDPQYMGALSPPSDCMTFFDDDIVSGPYMQSIWTVNILAMYEMTLLEVYDDTLSLTGKLALFVPLTSADAVSPGNVKQMIWRLEFDPDAPLLGSSSGPDQSVVTILPSNWDLRCMTAVSRKILYQGSHSEVVIVAALDFEESREEHLYVIETDIFGNDSWANATPYHMDFVMPPGSISGSFFGYDYNDDFVQGGGTLSVRGMAARVVAAGQGWPADRIGGIDLIFGAASNLRGDIISPKSPIDSIVGTLIFHIPPGDIAPTSGGTPVEPLDEYRARQFDEYAAGGIPPIVPLGWVQNPYSPTGDSFLLGRVGPRDAFSPGQEGNAGLCIFKLKREGNWGVRPVVMVGPDWVSEVSQTIGASLAWSTPPRSGDPAEGFEDLLIVTRPAVDRSDRYSTFYMEEDEATAAGYINAPPGATGDQPYLRRSDRNAGVVWTGHRVETRGYTERPTGMVPKTNATHRVLMTLRWSMPGNSWDRTFP